MVGAGESGAILAAGGMRGEGRREVEGRGGDEGSVEGPLFIRSDVERAIPEKVAAAIERGVRRGDDSTSDGSACAA